MRIYSDFDGTIATCDVTDLVLRELASPEWEEIEALWNSGEIDAATCMSWQIPLLQGGVKPLDRVLETVEIDSGFAKFADWCFRQNIEIVVVSDGVDYFIKKVLERHGYGHLRVYSNELIAEDITFGLKQGLRRPECQAGSGVCKCAVVSEALEPIIYIGDGKSDECVSGLVDHLFAKSKLVKFCQEREIPFTEFSTFVDVHRMIAGMMNGGPETVREDEAGA